jgi:hypothetical protein
MTDLLGGQVDVLCDQTSNTVGQIKAGKVRAIGVTSPKRLTQLPDVPTLAEQGLSGFELNVWHGLYAPRGTPRPVLERLNKAQEDSHSCIFNPLFRNLAVWLGLGLAYDDGKITRLTRVSFACLYTLCSHAVIIACVASLVRSDGIPEEGGRFLVEYGRLVKQLGHVVPVVRGTRDITAKRRAWYGPVQCIDEETGLTLNASMLLLRKEDEEEVELRARNMAKF